MKSFKHVLTCFTFILIVISLTACDNISDNSELSLTLTGYEDTIKADIVISDYEIMNGSKEGLKSLVSTTTKDISTDELTFEYYENDEIITDFTSAMVNASIYKIIIKDNFDNEVIISLEVLLQYRVVFYDKDEVIISESTVPYGSTVVAPIYDVEGYTVVWSSDTSSIVTDTVVYSSLISNENTITFVTNDGSSVSDIVQDKDTTLTQPEDPTKEGYTFVGWFTDTTLETPYIFPNVMPVESLVLYAKWEADTHVLTFQNNNETEDTILSQKTGTQLAQISDPIWQGYTFSGWFSDDSLTVPFTFPELMPVDNMTVYGKWVALDITIILELNNEEANVVIVQPTDSDLSRPTDPIKEGYVFEGWYIDQDLNTSYVFPSEMPHSNLTLYGSWVEETVVAGYEQSDELAVSINRMSEIDFDLNFEAMYAEEQASSPSNAFGYNRNTKTRLDETTSMNGEPVTLEDCVFHPLYSGVCYNEVIFEYPTEIDGLLTIDTFIDSMTSISLRTYEDSFRKRTKRAKDSVEWAVDNITLMDTWILSTSSNGTSTYYMLDYDQANDVVNLYTKYYGNETYNLEYSSLVSIYYNDQGQEVVEFFGDFYQTSPNLSDSSSYFIMVDSKDFNSSYYYYDSNGEFWNQHYIGLTEKDDGSFEYYSIFKPERESSPYFSHFDQYVRSGEHGWYIVEPIDYPNSSSFLFRPEEMRITLVSPNALDEVFSIIEEDGVFNVSINLTAFDGDLRVVFEETALYTSPIHYGEQRQEIIDLGLIPLDDYYYKMNSSAYQYIEGFDTEVGRFLNTDNAFNGVSLTHMQSSKAWDYNPPFDKSYHAYTSKAFLSIDADNMEDAFIKLQGYFSHVGLEYRYGDINDLFPDLINYSYSLESILNEANLVENIDDTLEATYSTYENYQTAINFMKNLALEATTFDFQINEDDVVPLADLPLKEDIDYAVFYDMEDIVEGMITVSDTGFDTSSLEYSILKKPILVPDREYNIYYALSLENKTFIIDSLTGQVYEGNHLFFTPSKVLDLPTDFQEGTFVLSHFLGKFTDQGIIQVSNNVAVDANEFDAFKVLYDSVYEGQKWEYSYLYHEGIIYVNVALIDVQSPSIIIDGITEPVTDSLSLTLYPKKTDTLDKLKTVISSITDNVDEYDKIIIEYYHDTFLITDYTPVFVNGDSYTIKVIDKSGNTTTIMFTVDLLHHVQFLDTEGSLIEEQYVKDGSSPTPPERSKPGYTVTWDTDFTNITSDLVVSEVLNPTNNMITLQANYGLEDTQIEQYTDTPLTQPDDPTKEGYTFDGWYTDIELTNTYVFPDTMPPNSFTLYASWDADTNTITLHANNETDDTQIQQETGTSLTQPDDPVKEGYTFDVWCIDDALTDPYTFPDTMPTTSFTLYGSWIANENTITFDTNEGSDVDSLIEVTGSSIMPPDDPIRDSYTFGGWFTDPELTDSYTFPDTMPTTSFTLYAKWDEVAS